MEPSFLETEFPGVSRSTYRKIRSSRAVDRRFASIVNVSGRALIRFIGNSVQISREKLHPLH